MRKIQLILNGKAASHNELRDAVAALRDEGIDIDVRVTWETGHAFQFAASVAHNAHCTVVAGGGDGTINEVVNGMASIDSPQAILGVLPYGTANDFASGAGVPKNDPYRALRLAAEATPKPIDLGCMNDRFFINVASGGFGAEVTANTPTPIKNLLGGSAYGLTALVMAMHARPYHGSIAIDDAPPIPGEMIMMAVGNARQAGGGTLMTPYATINDGLLDAMIVPSHDKAMFPHLLADLFELKEEGGKHYQYFRAKRIVLESNDELQFNLDGEPVRGNSFVFTVLPNAIMFAAPEQSPLLGSHE